MPEFFKRFGSEAQCEAAVIPLRQSLVAGTYEASSRPGIARLSPGQQTQAREDLPDGGLIQDGGDESQFAAKLPTVSEG